MSCCMLLDVTVGVVGYLKKKITKKNSKKWKQARQERYRGLQCLAAKLRIL